MAQTVGDLIRSSLRKIGVLAPGEPLPSDEGDDAKQVLIQMIDAWTNESLLIPVTTVITKQLLVGESEYTIGIYPEPIPVPLPDNHIEVKRPQQFLTSFIRDGAGTDYPLQVIGPTSYADTSRKDNEFRPTRLYIRKGWPMHTLIFNSLPFADETLHLETLQPLSEVLPLIGLTEEINLPPGYEKAIIFNLCIDLAPEYGKDITNVIAVTAMDEKRKIKRTNHKKLTLKVDRALVSNNRSKGTYIIEQGPG